MKEQKIVWITGASSGIGRELAKVYNKNNYFTILSSRNVSELEITQKELFNSEHSAIKALDLSKSEDFEDITKSIIQKYGRIDVLINNGGVGQRSEAFDVPLAVDRKIMEINYFGNIALTKSVLPIMRKQKQGRIIVISSIAGKFGFYLRSAYSASKHALQGFYESLLLEEAKNGIKVTLAYPGKINTPISLSAITAKGTPNGRMDHNQLSGMSAKKCAEIIKKAADKNKKSVLVGRKEIIIVYLKRYFPALFWRVIKNQNPT